MYTPRNVAPWQGLHTVLLLWLGYIVLGGSVASGQTPDLDPHNAPPPMEHKPYVHTTLPTSPWASPQIYTLEPLYPLHPAWRNSVIQRKHFQLSPVLWAIPSVLITSGAGTIHSLGWVKNRTFLTQSLQGSPHHLRYVDDVGQYFPLALATTLRLSGVKGRSPLRIHYVESAVIGGALMAGIVLGTKALGLQQRPDKSAWNSFMSGHTATAFLGAEILRIEYGERFPELAFLGYTVAVGTGFLRIYHHRHWLGDVLAGAGVGILAAWSGYLLQPYLDKGFQQLFPCYKRCIEREFPY